MKRALRLSCSACQDAMLLLVEGVEEEDGFLTGDLHAVRWMGSHVAPWVRLL